MSEINVAGEEIMDRRNSSVLERHFVTIASTLILVAIVWVGNTLITQGNNQVEMAGTINVINTELSHVKQLLRDAGTDRYTRSNANADHAKYDLIIQGLDKRVSELNQRVILMESLIRNSNLKQNNE